MVPRGRTGPAAKLMIVAGTLVTCAVIMVVALARARRAPAAPPASQVAALRAQLKALEGELAQQQSLLAREAVGRDRIPPKTPVAVPAAPAEQVGEEVVAEKPEPTSREIVAQIDAKFFREPAQTAWGQGAAGRARSVLRRLVKPGSELGAVDCRETLCRVEARHRDLDAYQAFATAVLDDERDQDGLWNAGLNSQVVEQSPTAVSSVTFLSREGAPVPGTDEPADLSN
jgi:hypothetical protein